MSDPHESEEYQRFVDKMAKLCLFDPDHRPCDGCLSGGICDKIGFDEPRDMRSESFEDEEN